MVPGFFSLVVCGISFGLCYFVSTFYSDIPMTSACHYFEIEDYNIESFLATDVKLTPQMESCICHKTDWETLNEDVYQDYCEDYKSAYTMLTPMCLLAGVWISIGNYIIKRVFQASINF